MPLLRVPASAAHALRLTAAAARLPLASVLAVALDQFDRLPYPMRRSLAADSLESAEPRVPLELPRLPATQTQALAAVWVFSLLPPGERLALVRQGAGRG